MQDNCVVPEQSEPVSENPASIKYERTDAPFKVVGASQVKVKLVLEVAVPAKFDGALEGDRVFDGLELDGK